MPPQIRAAIACLGWNREFDSIVCENDILPKKWIDDGLQIQVNPLARELLRKTTQRFMLAVFQTFTPLTEPITLSIDSFIRVIAKKRVADRRIAEQEFEDDAVRASTAAPNAPASSAAAAVPAAAAVAAAAAVRTSRIGPAAVPALPHGTDGAAPAATAAAKVVGARAKPHAVPHGSDGAAPAATTAARKVGARAKQTLSSEEGEFIQNNKELQQRGIQLIKEQAKERELQMKHSQKAVRIHEANLQMAHRERKAQQDEASKLDKVIAELEEKRSLARHMEAKKDKECREHLNYLTLEKAKIQKLRDNVSQRLAQKPQKRSSPQQMARPQKKR